MKVDGIIIIIIITIALLRLLSLLLLLDILCNAIIFLYMIFFSNRINGINVRCLDFGISYSEVGKDFS